MRNVDVLFDEVRDFLGGTFHQDMGSVKKALEEFLKEATIECLVNTRQQLNLFLKSNLSSAEKNKFIENSSAIYFPSINVTPLEWLEDVLRQIEQAIEEKGSACKN